MELIWFGFLVAVGMTVASIAITLVMYLFAGIAIAISWLWEKLTQ